MKFWDEEIEHLLFDEKKVVVERNRIYIPKPGKQTQLVIEQELNFLMLDINRKANNGKNISFNLRRENKTPGIISRFDIRGPYRTNMVSYGPYLNQRIETPHLHIMTARKYCLPNK